MFAMERGTTEMLRRRQSLHSLSMKVRFWEVLPNQNRSRFDAGRLECHSGNLPEPSFSDLVIRNFL